MEEERRKKKRGIDIWTDKCSKGVTSVISILSPA